MQWSRGFCPLPSAAAFLWRHVAFFLPIHRIIQWSVPLLPTIPPSLLPSCSDRLLSSFLPLSPLTHPPARRPPSLPRRSSVWSWSLSYIASFLSCHPRPSGRHRARERAPPPRTDQPANGQTVGRSFALPLPPRATRAGEACE